MSVIAVATVGSGIANVIGANKAAGAQKKAAQKSANVQREMFNRTDEIQKELYDQSVKDIPAAQKRAEELARITRNKDLQAAATLRNRGLDRATNTRDQNASLARNALTNGMDAARGARTGNIADFRREMATGTGRLAADRDANIGLFRREQDASLKPFEHTSEIGHNALSANAFNLGIGGKPAGYTGLELSPGAKFLLEQGRTDVEGGAAARGQLDSGATLEALEHLRSGTVATDRDNQQAQLLALAGLGNSADQSMAGIRGEYSGRIADARTGATAGINALRGGYTDRIAGSRDDFAKTAIGLNSDFADRMSGNNNNFNANAYGVDSNFTSGATAANDAYGANRTSAINFGLSNLLNARSQRADLFGSAATQYANGASNAFQAAGEARAGGAINTANAVNGTVGNLAWLKGQGALPSFGGGGGTGAPAAGTNWLASLYAR